MATNNLEASGTLHWIRVSCLWASNHQEVGRNRKLVLRLSFRALSKKELAQYLTKLRHQKQAEDDGGGPREFLDVSSIVSSYIVKYWVSVQKWTGRTIPEMGKEKAYT